VCPTNATYFDENGVVLVDSDKCILCTYCMNACPYDARYVDDRTMTVDKCTFCSDTRLARGEVTTACPRPHVRPKLEFWGLDDPNSEISQVLEIREHFSLKVSSRNQTKLFYLT